jgi:hypothetical protein
MANTLKFKRGLVAGIPTAALGEPLFTTDTFDLYIGNGSGNTRFQKYIASGTTSQLLRGDGSLLTMPIVLTSPANGQVLKYNGTSWVNDSDSGITGSGSAGQVSYWSGSTTQAGSNNLFWDATNSRLGIGTSTPTAQLHVSGATAGVFLTRSGTNDAFILMSDPTVTTGGQVRGLHSVSGLRFTNASSLTEWARFHATGNFSIGSTSDSGQRLQVTGDTLLRGSGNTSATTALTVQNSNGTQLFGVKNDGFINNGPDNVGTSIFPFTTSRAVANLAGKNLQWYSYNATDSAVLGRFYFGGARMTHTFGNVNEIYAGFDFAPTSGTAIYSNLNLSTTINQTGGANGITRGLYVNPTLTSAANWRSIEWSNNTGWGLYGVGTSNNYLGGRLSIGSQVNINNNSLQVKLNMTGASVNNGINSYGTIQSDVSSARYFISQASTQAASFTVSTLFHYYAYQDAFGAGSTVTNQYGFHADATLTGATNNYGFYGNIASGTGRWNLYMNGTANNYMAGRLFLGSTTDPSAVARISNTFSSDVAYGMSFNNTHTATTNTGYFFRLYNNSTEMFGINMQNLTTADVNFAYKNVLKFSYGVPVGAEVMRLTSLSNVLIGSTTDSGEKLQVTGTAKITGNLAVDTSTLFVDATNNKVAIGSTTFVSTEKFYVGDSNPAGLVFARIINTSTTSGSSSGIALTTNTNSGAAATSLIQSSSEDTNGNTSIVLQTSTTGSVTEKARLTSAGNLCIGATSVLSTERLLVSGLNAGSNTILRIYNTGSTTNTQSLLSFTTNGNGGSVTGAAIGGICTDTSGNMALQFITPQSGVGNNVNMQIRPTGNVLIQNGGTFTDSGERLQVTGTMKVTGATYLGSTLRIGYDVAQSVGGAVRNIQISGTDSSSAAVAIVRNSNDAIGGSITFAKTRATTNGGLTIAQNNDRIGALQFSYSDGTLIQSTSASVIGEVDGTPSAANVPGRLVFSTVPSGLNAVERMRISANGNVAIDTNTLFVDATNNRVGIGTSTPSVAAHILGALRVDTSGITAIQTDTNRNFYVNTTATGTGAVGTMVMGNGTAPSSSPSDMFQMYSADITAGNAAPHFRTENGAVIKLYQETTAVGNSTISLGGGSAVLDDTEFDGYTLRQIVRALRNQGILQ